MFDINEELKKLPDKPGVYIMHDAPGNIIYVGKAISLKNRVRQYFQKRVRSPKIERMISLIDHFEYIVVDSEVEALVLECNLIKENRPKYNTMLMDDKSYPFIKVTVGEDYPRAFLTHNVKKDGSRYFGPYTDVGAAKNALTLLDDLYGLRPCRKTIEKGKLIKPCLYYDVHKCKAPCAGYVSDEEYAALVKNVIEFLSGNVAPVKRKLKEDMKEAAEAMEFEKAAQLRDLIADIERVVRAQKITASDEGDRDVIGISVKDDRAVAQVFFIRKGKMTGREHFYLTEAEGETTESLLGTFIKQFYTGNPNIPGVILLPAEPEEKEALEEFLCSLAGYKVTMRVPARGDKEGLVRLANDNAKMVLEKDRERLESEHEGAMEALGELAGLLGIETPRRIESYDISNTSGVESVGSMVVHENGLPKKSDYRKFKIKTVKGPDDYASLAEVLRRRLTHRERIQDGDDSFNDFPDLILMDGGRGQVNIALDVMDELGLDIRVCGLVKDDHHRTRGLYCDGVEVPISVKSAAFMLITRIQDETHRFAIEYHRELRSKGQVRSILDDIPLIGPKRRRALMKAFGSIEALREADIGTIQKVADMNEAAAESVYNFFHNNE
ncbi:MAG: excinuclease ABC subunit UvrC [Lachnospiraceae bacterium]|nr:excinuclease ABC subunit UvrC [Lachnospiraceae bacterium]